jgi:hypothetical protein
VLDGERRAPTSGGPARGATQQRLRADQKGAPGRSRQETTEGGEDQAVAKLEARPTDLALEDAELVAEGEDLDLEDGIALHANQKEVDQGADDRIQETQDHGLGS